MKGRHIPPGNRQRSPAGGHVIMPPGATRAAVVDPDEAKRIEFQNVNSVCFEIFRSRVRSGEIPTIANLPEMFGECKEVAIAYGRLSKAWWESFDGIDPD